MCTLPRFTRCTIVLTLLPPNSACSPFAHHTQQSHSPELAETFLEDADRLDGRKRVVLLEGGIDHVYSGPLELR